MKIEDVLVRYLLKNKSLTLQGIGTFYINKEVNIPDNAEAETILPADILHFDYDPKTVEDENLVSFFTLMTKKIKPLASADLDSFITLGKQFLNIGKPFIIEGLGTLEKNQEGSLTFKAGVFVSPRIEAPKTLTGGEKEISSGLFGDSHRNPPPNYDRRILTIIALIIVLCLAGWGVYYFFIKQGKQKTLVETTITDTESLKPDTLQQTIDTTKKTESIIITSDSVNFFIVVRDSLSDNRATNIQKRLISYGHTTVVKYAGDSLNGIYKIGQPFFRPLKDTAWLKDSLFNIYHTHSQVERR